MRTALLTLALLAATPAQADLCGPLYDEPQPTDLGDGQPRSLALWLDVPPDQVNAISFSGGVPFTVDEDNPDGIRIRPTELLAADTDYFVVIGLTGGRTRRYDFRTGDVVDTTPPTLRAARLYDGLSEKPCPGDFVGGELTVDGEDEGTPLPQLRARLRLGGAVTEVDWGTKMGFGWPLDESPLPPGNHDGTVELIDPSGNVSAAVPVSVTLTAHRTPPMPSDLTGCGGQALFLPWLAFPFRRRRRAFRSAAAERCTTLSA